MLTADYTNILLDLKEAIVTDVVSTKETLTISLEQPRTSHSCPACCATTEKVHDYRYQKVKDIAIQGKQVVLILRKRRYICRVCHKRFLEKNSLLARYQRMTKRLLSYLLSLFSQTCSIKSIAQQCNCAPSTAARHFEKVSYPKPRLPSVLSIDEFKGNAGGHKFQCILTNPEKNELLDILPSRTSEDLCAYFTSFSMEERMQVNYVVMDMSALFASVVKQCFPNAKIVVDKFHVARLANWAMEAIRKEEQKKFGSKRRIYYKRSRWLLLKRLNKLSDAEKLQLANLLSISEPLRKAYLLKEEFYDMLNSTTHADMIVRWNRWQDRVVEAGLPTFDRFMQTTAKWSKAIINAAKTGYSNGFTEGCNNRIKVLKRVSYGVKNFVRFRNRILYIAN